MGRRKKKTGFYLKYIPKNRMKTLFKLAQKYPLQNKTKAFYKYVEVFSTIVEGSKDSQKNGYVGISVSRVKEDIGVDNSNASRILKDLVSKKFLAIDKTTYVKGIAPYSYKPIAKSFSMLLIWRNSLDETDDNMLHSTSTRDLEGDAMLYEKVVHKLELDDSVYGVLSSATKIKKLSHYKENLATAPYQEIGTLIPQEISLLNILAKKFRISRPIEDSRVYTNITNLKKDYRKYLRLNGKALIGFDISNCQPLLAAIAFRRHSLKKYGYIKEDVLRYQSSCENGLFYEAFMKLNGIDVTNEDERGKFKEKFFGNVFYMKEYKKVGKLKKQFIEMYPTCQEAMLIIKGEDIDSEEFKEFAALMTEFETVIMFETNIELIKRGYDVVNIFDSLYSDSEEAIKVAKELVTKAFSQFDIKPKFKDIDYR
ncbi:MAG TPA: hypothetical protein VF622_07110 [Segetibacter sp.]|jgi:predicted transcriptional regulator